MHRSCRPPGQEQAEDQAAGEGSDPAQRVDIVVIVRQTRPGRAPTQPSLALGGQRMLTWVRPARDAPMHQPLRMVRSIALI